MRPLMSLVRNCVYLSCLVVQATALTLPATAASTGSAAAEPATTGTLDNNLASAISTADPVVGNVEGHLIHLNELSEASKHLPENLRGLPFDTLYPVLLDRMIDHQSLVIMAKRRGLEEEHQQEIQAAIEHILEGAYLKQVAAPLVTEQAIQARYNRRYANRPATEEVRARHILLTTEAEAHKVLADLQKGAEFATLARAVSKDPDASKGGDLGFFRREQVWPAFADVAFSLPPGQVAPTPIKNEFGWHVIKVEERRVVAPPTISEVHDELRQELLAAAVQDSIAIARSQLTIHRYNMDGSEIENGSTLTVFGSDSPPAIRAAGLPDRPAVALPNSLADRLPAAPHVSASTTQ